LVIQVEARALDFPLDPVVRIADAAGKTLVQMDDPGREGGRDPEVTWTPPQDGTYLLEVRDLHDRGGGRYAYRLRLTAATPDYDLTLAADRFTLTPGKPLEIAVTVNRRHGLAKPITIRAVDLPDGVTAEPATSQPTGETAKAVKLRLTATATAKAGPFRIVGSADGQPERRAVAPIAGFPATTAAPWLTVVPEPAKK
jgi:hypothetical protein